TSQTYNTKSDRGLSSLDLRHNLVVNGLWSLPSPFKSGMGAYIVGGWRLSGIFSVSSGAPFTINSGGRNAPDGSRSAGRQRPELMPGRTSENIISGTTSGCTFGTVGPVGSNGQHSFTFTRGPNPYVSIPANDSSYDSIRSNILSNSVAPGQKLGTPD